MERRETGPRGGSDSPRGDGSRRTPGPRALACLYILLTVAACGDSSPSTEPPVPSEGDLDVLVSTYGGDPDSDGYGLLVGDIEGPHLDIRDSVRLEDIPRGTYFVQVTDVAGNCGARIQNPREAYVPGGGVGRIAFTFDCDLLFGTLLVTTSTSGPPTPAGYPFTVAGREETVPASGALRIEGIRKGGYAVDLAVPPNCTATGPADATVVAGEVVQLRYDINCRPFDLTGRVLFSGYLHLHQDMGYGLYSALTDGSDVINFGYRNARTDRQMYPTVSADGSIIAYEQNDTLYLNDGDGLDPRPLPQPAGGLGAFPAISPDGSRVAFTRDGDLYVAAVDGTALTRLTDSPYDDRTPAWHPNGQYLAFVRDSASINRLYAIDAGGFGLTRLRDDTRHYVEPAWSPDGLSILVLSGDYGLGFQMTRLAADGSNPRDLFDARERAASPAWSPDGSRISYHFDAGYGIQRILILDTLGTVLDSIPHWYDPVFFHGTWGPAE